MAANSNSKSKSPQPLVTPRSVALSLSPPRVPPHGSGLRRLYTHPSARRHLLHRPHRRGAAFSSIVLRLRRGAAVTVTDDDEEDERTYQSHTLPSRLLQLLPATNRTATADILRHPHLPTTLSVPDHLTRLLGSVLTIESQHSFRDSGMFKRVADNMVALSCPALGIGHPGRAREFFELTWAPPDVERGVNITADGGDADIKHDSRASRRKKGRWTRRRIRYGEERPMQCIDLFLPCSDDSCDKEGRTQVRGTLFFVHGGAWGSGKPWMYRLVAPTFLDLNFAVVVVGYRTYPDARTIGEQCGDCRAAWDICNNVLSESIVPVRGYTKSDDADGWVGNVVMGHSSGAHVALLMLAGMIGEWMNLSPPLEKNTYRDEDTTMHGSDQYPWKPDYFVGLSGPYDISYHFDFEAGRGLEQISPMKPICGHTRESFDRASPVKCLMALLRRQRIGDGGDASLLVHSLMPSVLLVHGIEDSTVPFTATSDAGRALRSMGLKRCDEIYLEETGHQDVIMHFMLGGPAKDLVLDWLWKCSGREKATIQSRL